MTETGFSFELPKEDPRMSQVTVAYHKGDVHLVEYAGESTFRTFGILPQVDLPDVYSKTLKPKIMDLLKCSIFCAKDIPSFGIVEVQMDHPRMLIYEPAMLVHWDLSNKKQVLRKKSISAM